MNILSQLPTHHVLTLAEFKQVLAEPEAVQVLLTLKVFVEYQGNERLHTVQGGNNNVVSVFFSDESSADHKLGHFFMKNQGNESNQYEIVFQESVRQYFNELPRVDSSETHDGAVICFFNKEAQFDPLARLVDLFEIFIVEEVKFGSAPTIHKSANSMKTTQKDATMYECKQTEESKSQPLPTRIFDLRPFIKTGSEVYSISLLHLKLALWKLLAIEEKSSMDMLRDYDTVKDDSLDDDDVVNISEGGFFFIKNVNNTTYCKLLHLDNPQKGRMVSFEGVKTKKQIVYRKKLVGPCATPTPSPHRKAPNNNNNNSSSSSSNNSSLSSSSHSLPPSSNNQDPLTLLENQLGSLGIRLGSSSTAEKKRKDSKTSTLGDSSNHSHNSSNDMDIDVILTSIKDYDDPSTNEKMMKILTTITSVQDSEDIPEIKATDSLDFEKFEKVDVRHFQSEKGSPFIKVNIVKDVESLNAKLNAKIKNTTLSYYMSYIAGFVLPILPSLSREDIEKRVSNTIWKVELQFTETSLTIHVFFNPRLFTLPFYRSVIFQIKSYETSTKAFLKLDNDALKKLNNEVTFEKVLSNEDKKDMAIAVFDKLMPATNQGTSKKKRSKNRD